MVFYFNLQIYSFVLLVLKSTLNNSHQLAQKYYESDSLGKATYCDESRNSRNQSMGSSKGNVKVLFSILNNFKAEDMKMSNYSEDQQETAPLLFVDVNFGPGRAQRISIYPGDRADQLAISFAQEHSKFLKRDLLSNYLFN